MPEGKDYEKDMPRSFEEIEKKIKEVLARKNEEVKEEEEAEGKEEGEKAEEELEQGGRESWGEEALGKHAASIAEFKNDITNLKNKVKEHLEKLNQFYKELEALTGQALEEFERVADEAQKLESLSQETEEKVSSLKKEIEEKFKALGKPPEEEIEGEVDFGEELARVKKLKDLLEKPEPIEAEEEEKEEEVEKEEMAFPEPLGETVVAAEEEEEKEIGLEAEEKTEEMEARISKPEMEGTVKEEPGPDEFQEAVFQESPEKEARIFEKEIEGVLEEEAKEEKPLPGEEQEAEFKVDEAMETMFSGRWKKHWQEAAAKKEETAVKKQEAAAEEKEAGVQEPESEALKKRRASDFAEILQTFRKNDPPDEDSEVWYYENQGKMILDSECIVLALGRQLEEGKKLHLKLSQTGSPKEQFFVKQDILKHQEALRDVFLRSMKLLDKESCSLPQYTIKVVDNDFLKEILEKLSVENWSNQDDFSFFEEYAERIKSEFNQLMTSKVDYFKSIVDELKL